MSIRLAALRGFAGFACLIVLGAACSSSGNAADSNAATSTTTVEQKPNDIPFNVGDKIGLAGGWTVTITKVTRPFTNPQLAGLDEGREYTALDVTMQNRGTSTQDVDAAKVFSLGDSTGQIDEVVSVPGRPNGLDGIYAPEKERAGQLVFDVPVDAQLRMALDGTLIGSQHAIFMVDPPTVAPAD
jgi:hypothetical protein